MTLRIAFCGPYIETNQWLAEEVKKLIADFAEPVVMRHPIEGLLEFTRSKEWAKDIDWLTLNTNVWRALEEIRYEGEEFLISPSCGIDNVATSAAWLAEQAKAMEMKGMLLGADGKQIIRQDHVIFNRTGSILQVLLNSAEEEAITYWDFIYAVLPVPSIPSPINDELLTQYHDFITSVPAFDKVEQLSANKTSALDALQQEVEKWKNHHNSSS